MTLVPWRGKRPEEETDDTALSSPLSYFRGEMDRLFERFFGESPGMPFGLARTGTGWMPSLDVSETDTDITVRAEVPGLDPKDLEITVSGQVLTIAGEKKEATEEKGENYFHSERRFGSFKRSVQLPAPVDTEKVTAEHKNGVIKIQLHKQQSALPKRIPVQIAKDL